MRIFGLQNIDRLFFPAWKRLNMLHRTLFVLSLLLNTIFLFFFFFYFFFFFFAFYFEFALVRATFLDFNLEKHHSLFRFSFLTTADLFCRLFLRFLTLKTYTVPTFFVDRVQKPNCHISVSTLHCKTCCFYRFLIF